MTTPLDITDFVYNTGTLTIAPGDTTAVFTGTSLSMNVKDGDYLFAGGSLAVIETVTDDTHVDLFTEWAGSSVTAGTYVILKASMLRNNAVQIGYDTAAFLAFLDNTTIWYVVDGDAPDPSIGEDGNRALKTNVSPWKQWLKTGGVWVLQAGSPGAQGDPGATWITQASEPSTDYPANSLWIDSDSTDLDVYELSGSPLAWTDTGMNLKGTTGPTGSGVPTGGSTGQVLSKVSGTDNDTAWIDPPETGDVAGDTHAATSKTTPVDADELPLVDSAASNVLKKLTWANLKAALKSAFGVPSGGTTGQVLAKASGTDNDVEWVDQTGGSGGREVLTANRTYYVDSINGSDSNDGLASGSGHAFATIQKAINSACGLDLSIYAVTIQLAGSFTESPTLKTYVGAGPVTIVGDETTPSNCTITGTGSQVAVFLADGVLAKWRLAGMKLTHAGSTKSLIVSYAGSIVEIRNIDCGSATNAQLQADTSGIINVQDGYNYTISGGAPYHMQALRGGIFKMNGLTVTNTITLTGTPAFSTAFAAATIGGIIRAPNAYSGSATGVRFAVDLNGVIGLGGVTLPGSTTGTTSTGGQCA